MHVRVSECVCVVCLYILLHYQKPPSKREGIPYNIKRKHAAKKRYNYNKYQNNDFKLD